MDRFFSLLQTKRVVVNGVKSDWAPVLSGVPQGTVLGPLLFSLYINDISSDIESELRLFADDCVCYPLRKRLRTRSVISVNYHYVTFMPI